MIKKIKVLACTHDVKDVGPIRYDDDEEGVYRFAFFDSKKNLIGYDAKNVRKHSMGMFLLHEVLESIIWQNDIDLDHTTLSTLSIALTSTLTENPEFTKMFLGGTNV